MDGWEGVEDLGSLFSERGRMQVKNVSRLAAHQHNVDILST